ncbi:MAG: type 1 glutamine amidotransferase [Chloroflexi bacterium]|nr:type 1 glutamine amidotransferase [Chloroflexota bacterium]
MKVQKEKLIADKKPFRAIILAADGFEDMEMFVPFFRLLEEGIVTDVAAPAKDKITGKKGYSLENVDMIFEEVEPAGYGLLLLPGGHAPAIVRKSPKAQEIARAFMESGRPVAAICHGLYTLISAGLVKGRRMTSYPGDGVPDEIRRAGGSWVDKEVEVDGNLVTSRLPEDLPAFNREIMRLVRQAIQPQKAGAGR